MNANRNGIGPEEARAYQQLMRTKLSLFQAQLFCAVALGIGSSFGLAAAAGREVGSVERGASERRSVEPSLHSPRSDAPRLPWSQIGAKAGADYQGDGLAVSPTAEGARLRCVFQRLEGEATREGLWLTSTVTDGVSDRFRVTAAEVGREGVVERGASERRSVGTSLYAPRSYAQRLPSTGTVAVEGQTVRFTRPGLVEEYSVSMDGVRQDFVIEHPPLNPQLSTLNQRPGELSVRLAVSGAKVEPAAGGAQLVLDNSGRKIAYSRLRVTDATGKELTARMEVRAVGDEVTSLKSFGRAGNYSEEVRLLTSSPTGAELVVLVNDAEAVYPVRIDPTFSDANWISFGGISGANGGVLTAVMDGSGNLYVGGGFTLVGDVLANNIAKWNGSSWSALGSGMGGGSYPNGVYALAVSGSDLYAGGYFTTSGGKVSAYVAKAIVNPPVLAIAGDGDGGYFIRFSGVPGSAYRLERAPGLSGPWAASGPQTALATGLVEFWDLFPPPGQGFYRSVQP